MVGFGWQQYHHQWSKDGVEFTTDQLAMHLKYFTSKERKIRIPSQPPIEMPLLRNMSWLGELTADAKELNEKLQTEGEDFVEATSKK